MGLSVTGLSAVEPSWLVIGDGNGEGLLSGGVILVGTESGINTSRFWYARGIEGRLGDGMVIGENVEQDNISNLDIGDILWIVLENWCSSIEAANLDGLGRSSTASWTRISASRARWRADRNSGSELLERFEGLVASLGGIYSENHTGLTMGLSVTRLSAVEPSWLVIGDSNGEGLLSGGVILVGTESGINTSRFWYARGIEGGFGDGMVIGENVEQDNISNLDIGDILWVVLENGGSSIETSNLNSLSFCRITNGNCGGWWKVV